MKNLSLFILSIFFLSMSLQVNKHRLYIIGDSTACIYSSSLYPRTGWAQVLQNYFLDDSILVIDKAQSGRSSKSFFDEGLWAPIKNDLRQGDYVLIQFGHNDEKTSDPVRGTLPGTTFKQYLSRYIDDAIAKGAVPVLATPIERNSWNGNFIKSTHVTANGDYPQAIRELAETKNVGLIDATSLTKAFFEEIGRDSATQLFMNLAAGEWPNYPGGNSDNTHLCEEGAKAVSELIVNEIAVREMQPLSTWIIGNVTALNRNGDSFSIRNDVPGNQRTGMLNQRIKKAAFICDLQGKKVTFSGISGYTLGNGIKITYDKTGGIETARRMIEVR